METTASTHPLMRVYPIPLLSIRGSKEEIGLPATKMTTRQSDQHVKMLRNLLSNHKQE
jgi:hypothetical protein